MFEDGRKAIELRMVENRVVKVVMDAKWGMFTPYISSAEVRIGSI